jgi:hypothetical protein
VSILLLLSSLVFSAGVLPIKAYETICIRADGSIDPPTAPISARAIIDALIQSTIMLADDKHKFTDCDFNTQEKIASS